jgi:hypothetical protein
MTPKIGHSKIDIGVHDNLLAELIDDSKVAQEGSGAAGLPNRRQSRWRKKC